MRRRLAQQRPHLRLHARQTVGWGKKAGGVAPHGSRHALITVTTGGSGFFPATGHLSNTRLLTHAFIAVDQLTRYRTAAPS